MTYNFPPDIPMSIGIPAFVLNLLILAIALAAIFGVFAWREPISRKSRIVRILIAVGMATAISVSGLINPPNARTNSRVSEFFCRRSVVDGSDDSHSPVATAAAIARWNCCGSWVCAALGSRRFAIATSN